MEGLAFDTITLLNHVTTKGTYPDSPKSLVCGNGFDLAKWRSFSAGDFGMFWRPYNSVDKDEGRWEHGYIIGHAAGSHPRVLLLPGVGGHEVIRHRNFKLLPPSTAQVAMLAALVVKDGPAAYHEMLSDWKLELSSTPDDFPYIRTTPLVHLRAPAYPLPADKDLLPHMMPTIT
jgi:hypothetical protein